MFGCLLPGRAVQTNMQQIDETHAVFSLGNPSSINHLCVFLLGTVPFPEGYAATVHFHWPGRGFQLLGMLSNEKPSAIFRLRGTFTAGVAPESYIAFSAANDLTMSDSSATPSTDTALLGISIEPISSVMEQCAHIASNSNDFSPSQAAEAGVVSKPADPTVLAEKIGKHLFNYLSSFSTPGHLTPETFVPLGAITKWYDSFRGKVKAGGITFLERDN